MSMHNQGRLRKKVREVLALAAGYYLSEAQIFDNVNELLEPDAELCDVRAAVEWNVSENYIKSRYNDDYEQREWTITKAGIAKETIN